MEGTSTKHGLLGKVRLINKYSESAMEYEYKTKDPEQITRWEQLQRLYASIPRTNLLLPLEVAKKQQGDETTFKIIFGDYFYVLDHERGNRELTSDKFTEKELWYLLFNMVETSKSMIDAGLHLCTPCGDTILLNQFGYIQIFSELSLPNWKDILQTRSLSLSPEQIQAKSNPTLNIGLDRSKSQSFNIGVTLIELATLSKLQKAYEGDQIKEVEIHRMVRIMMRDYSDFLCKIVGSMVKMNSNERSSTGQVWAALEAYRDEINEMKGFDPRRDRSTETLHNYLKSTYKVI